MWRYSQGVVLVSAWRASWSSTPAYAGPAAVYSSGDATGVTDGANIAAAIAALPSGGGVVNIVAGAKGPFYLTSTAGNAALTFGPNQGMLGPGTQECLINYIGAGIAILAEGPAGSSDPGGAFKGFKLSGTASGQVGLQWSNLSSADVDIEVDNFSATTGTYAMPSVGGVGVYCFNSATTGSTSEKGRWVLRLANNGNNLVFDSHSFDYSVVVLYLIVSANQVGVTLQNSAQLVGCDLTMLGDFHAGVTNTGWALGIDPAGAGVGTSVLNGHISLFCEADAGTGSTGHIPIKFDGAEGASGGIQGAGVMYFVGEGESWQNVSGLNSNGAIYGSFYGSIPGSAYQAPGLPDGVAFWGGTQRQAVGSTTSPSHLTSLQVGRADFVFGQLVGGSNAVALSNFPTGASQARVLDLFIIQPASGGAGTVTWPANFFWPGGTAPTLSTTNGAIDHIRATYMPTLANFYCELVGLAYSA